MTEKKNSSLNEHYGFIYISEIDLHIDVSVQEKFNSFANDPLEWSISCIDPHLYDDSEMVSHPYLLWWPSLFSVVVVLAHS